MYKRVGLDPTKTRPSSEALLRRVRRGDPLPRINSMVDVCNWCSLEFQLPYGLYDASRIDGDVELRIGRARRVVPGHSQRTTSTSADGSRSLTRRGPFGNPTSDSARTMVTTATTRALLVVFAPREVEARRLATVLDSTSSRMTEFTGCRRVRETDSRTFCLRHPLNDDEDQPADQDDGGGAQRADVVERLAHGDDRRGEEPERDDGADHVLRAPGGTRRRRTGAARTRSR